MKLDIEYSETFEDDLIEIYELKNYSNLWWDKIIFNFNFTDLKYNKYVPELIIEFDKLYNSFENIKKAEHSMKLLQEEYLKLTQEIKPYYFSYNYEEIEWKSQFIKLRYNDLFKEYKFWLVNKMVEVSKQENQEWKVFINALERFIKFEKL